MVHTSPNLQRSDEEIAIKPVKAREELAACLSRPKASIPPKYFYDLQGSKLFEAICSLDEYYLTRTEGAILLQNGKDIAEHVGEGTTLVDLGAGNCSKAAALVDVLKLRAYVPVDISAAFLWQAVVPLTHSFPDLEIHPVELDFSENFLLPPKVQSLQRKVFFYPGSSLGNFTPLQAQRLLHNLHNAGGDLLFGLDLVKDSAMLEAAYDDALGITSAFNLNALRHVNLLLGSDFHLKNWQHYAIFNPAQSRVEMYLRAKRACRVCWPGGFRDFAELEMIHTENCYKFTRKGATDMFHRAGFGDVTCWSDPAETYLVCHARAH